MRSRRWMEDSESWRAVERLKEGQSIPDVALFFGIHHSVISRLWRQSLTSHCPLICGLSSNSYDAADYWNMAIVAKQNRRTTCTNVTSIVASPISKTIYLTTVRQRLNMSVLYPWVPKVTLSHSHRVANCSTQGMAITCVYVSWSPHWKHYHTL